MKNSESSTVEIAHDLERWFRDAQRIVIIGVGSPIRRDDNIGPEVITAIEGKVSESVLLVRSETIPEEHLGTIVDFKPTHVLIVDAALLGLAPGSVRLVESLQSSPGPVSTHFLPLRIFSEYVAQMTRAKIALLLVQPKDAGFGEALTPEIQCVKENLAEILVHLFRMVLK